MKRNAMKIVIAVLCLLALPHSAQAAVRSFSNPTQADAHLQACSTESAACGKAVADAFCKAEGFAESILFAREPLANGTGVVFTRIKCYAPGEVAEFPSNALIQ
jgi:curli biogenesis system outer membrane secretion channel CsgG